jgi:hypothetical protein
MVCLETLELIYMCPSSPDKIPSYLYHLNCDTNLRLEESLATSMSVRHSRGPEMVLTLLNQLLLLPLSRKTLDARYLILIG